jgi:hypothetical protein
MNATACMILADLRMRESQDEAAQIRLSVAARGASDDRASTVATTRRRLAAALVRVRQPIERTAWMLAKPRRAALSR